jgi:hypothetical protein
MDRKNNLKAFERGVRAMMGQGIAVKVDLIVGLPGDTVDSVRRGMRYLKDNGLYNDVQVFNLSILPGTAFRQEAEQLGLKFQPRPPYYVLQTPALGREDLYGLMEHAQDFFDIEFDAQPPPVLRFDGGSLTDVWRVDLDQSFIPELSAASDWAQAFTLWFRSADFQRCSDKAAGCIRRVLAANPFTTLQVVLDLSSIQIAADAPGSLSSQTLEALTTSCLQHPTYLDCYYALQPGRANGAKRLIVVLPASLRSQLDEVWLEQIGATATIVWRESRPERAAEAGMGAHEYAWVS